MMMAELPTTTSDDFGFVVDGDDVSMDLMEFWQILEEDPDRLQSDPSYSHMGSSPDGGPAPDLVNHGNDILQIENIFDANMGDGTLSENSAETTEAQGHSSTSPSEMSLISSNTGIFSVPGFSSTEGYSSLNCQGEDTTGGTLKDNLPDSAHYPPMSLGGEFFTDMKPQVANPQPPDLWLGNDLMSRPLQGGADVPVDSVGIDQQALGFASYSNNFGYHHDTNSYNSFKRTVLNGASGLPLRWKQSFKSSQKPLVPIENSRNDQLFFPNGRNEPYRVEKEVPCGEFSFGSDVGNFAGNTVAMAPHMKCFGVPKAEGLDDFFDFAEPHHVSDACRRPQPGYQIPTSYGEYMDMKSPLNSVHSLGILASCNFNLMMERGETAEVTHSAILSSGTIKTDTEVSLANCLDDDEDPDVCIVENFDLPGQAPSLTHGRDLITVHQSSGHSSTFQSEITDLPRQVAPSLTPGRSLVTSHRSSSSTSFIPAVGEGTRSRGTDERLIFRAAMQDLSQPKSEAILPDGVLEVPLLRHQRIALSWMVQKETASWQCSGGILADDQGLGKTISMIALILKERPPSKMSGDTKNDEHEMLDLDASGDQFVGSDTLKMTNHEQARNVYLKKSLGTCGPAKGRPAAGTLIVCPTSVIRQWAEELHSKVTSKANLSVYMYHGSNRTKDPFELAKYDVVLTTYSIVSMEVPKQSVRDKEDEKMEPDEYPPSSSKKRKCSSKSSAKCFKRGKDDMLQESVQRPLARVGWFRVVLDEAQSIKNHKTRVAQACWGLRSKRRWCLSGTPLQNAVDDLYSYFRFLRYDPYDGYRQFCALVKFPITKNPTQGYKKLQAVLKTIMLRRTKATLIDGEPIINLPPKSVELKKVEFSVEERDFYSRLESDSRAQFAEYEAYGTIQQNYVNILLMLLRLRQACDHPLLVQGFDSTSIQKSSTDMANKLPREKLLSLLTCLEASLAICSICNDYPEDAVVSRCCHVFCNQCISEHLTGDDNQCPARNCKVQLSASSVFSRATLKRCLSDQAPEDSSPSCSGSQSSPCSEVIEPCLAHQLHDSSKIKAVLHVLQSLNKPSHDVVDNKNIIQSIGMEQSCSVASGSPGALPAISDEFSVIETKKEGLNKLVSVRKEKAIVFSQWTRMLDLLEACLKETSIQYRRLDGTMTVVARDRAVRDFNTLPEVSVVIMSLKAASLGLNMVAACHVVLLDLWWNPTTEDQAIDRAHRIGQTRPVSVVRLTVKDTVEDRILALQQRKREMVASVFGEDGTGGSGSRLTVEDLRYLFKF
ncbi:hypothetical protein Dimus_035195 [Dionaea muscipula]